MAGSTPPVGSSKKTILGLWKIETEKASFCFQPKGSDFNINDIDFWDRKWFHTGWDETRWWLYWFTYMLLVMMMLYLFGNDDYEVVHLDGDSSKAVIGITFTTDSIPTINTKYDAKFSINVLNVMPVNAEGDIVILPGVTE